jgi:serine phosphatase RsbU (regulator of sigma subunit)
VAEVFLEYRLLRRTILEVLDEGAAVSPPEREVINDGLERALQDAVSQFTNVHHAQQRAEAEEWRTSYQRERHIADMLQRPLLQKVAEDAVAGLSLATFYEPAREEAQVGGDFFDVVPLAGGRVALVVGDTCGKGLEAAVHNTHTKDVLRAFLLDSPSRPAGALARLNNVLCDLLEREPGEDRYRFVVLALLLLDPATGAGYYSSAGAEPLLLVRAGGAVEVVERPAMPLGIEPGISYGDVAVHLEPGDTAAMLTDGIPEARRGPTLLGYDAVVDLVARALRAPSLDAAGEEVLAEARRFAGGCLQDDACLILARRR